MIPVSVFDYLIVQKSRDAKVLLQNDRHAAAVYMMGYALEYCLKKKICSTLRFTSGFPENKTERRNYITIMSASSVAAANPITFSDIREIKNHDLARLLTYSGAQVRVVAGYAIEWAAIAGWNPEKRYVRQRISKQKAKEFIRSANILIPVIP